MGEIYKQATGVKAVEVVYRVGVDSLNDLQSGQVDYGMYDPVFSMSQAREGRVRIRAKATVLACGTLHTPVLLMRQGLAGASGQLGRNLSIHPAAAALGLFERVVARPKHGARVRHGRAEHHFVEGV